ncbi:MAG: hypothetical protein NTZ73_03600 [Candidatus Diapherotrites archaeon]|nr:hypothetical protein [Candidatus Diapherotrites archaeon]
MDEHNALVVFQDKKIRRVWHNEEWFFSITDVVEALTDSPSPRQYWGKVKDREFEQLELSPIWVQLKLPLKAILCMLVTFCNQLKFGRNPKM